MLGLLGKKVGMTQIFDEKGKQVGVTVLEVGPCFVTDLRTDDDHGYSAVQLGYGPAKEKNVSKAEKGHFKRANAPVLKYVKEFRVKNLEGLELGQELKVDNFEVGDFLDITGVSKGQGFQGVVKRHDFAGGESAHGSKFGREIGSSGQSAYPSRVIKGTGMAGQMGNIVTTTQNIEVLKVDTENNLLVVKGAVPGARGHLLTIVLALKKGSDRGWKVPQSAESEDSQEVTNEPADENPKAEVESKKDVASEEKSSGSNS